MLIPAFISSIIISFNYYYMNNPHLFPQCKSVFFKKLFNHFIYQFFVTMCVIYLSFLVFEKINF